VLLKLPTERERRAAWFCLLSQRGRSSGANQAESASLVPHRPERLYLRCTRRRSEAGQQDQQRKPDHDNYKGQRAVKGSMSAP